MKKRLLAAAMALCMAFTLMPATAMAADTEISKDSSMVSTPVRSQVQIEKSVSTDAQGNRMLTMDAWVTDHVTQTVVARPLDIVLVLDVSGSMDDTMTSYTFTETKQTAWSYDDIDKSSQYYYWYNEADQQYYPVYTRRVLTGGLGNLHWEYVLYTQVHELGRSTSKTEKIYNEKLYRHTGTTTTKKIDALKNAVNLFIDSVAKHDQTATVCV